MIENGIYFYLLCLMLNFDSILIITHLPCMSAPTCLSPPPPAVSSLDPSSLLLSSSSPTPPPPPPPIPSSSFSLLSTEEDRERTPKRRTFRTVLRALPLEKNKTGRLIPSIEEIVSLQVRENLTTTYQEVHGSLFSPWQPQLRKNPH